MKPVKSYRIETGEITKYTVYLVGCGGTGSFAALHLARLAYVANQKNVSLNLVFIDPDTVEFSNIGRQNFIEAEVGTPKAVALARRYSYAFGLQIEARVEPFKTEMVSPGWRDLALVIGCVDNAAARREINRAIAGGRVWWLDSGNSLDSGQVLIGNAPKQAPVIDPTGFAVGVPWPSLQEATLLDNEPAPAVAPASCAELMAQEAQSLMINQAMAGWVATYAYRLILGRDLDIMATYVNLAAGSVRSVPVTGEIGKIEPVKEEAAVRPAMVGREVMVVGELDDQQLRLIYARVCPNCGGALIEGREDIDEVETPILFCAPCDWMIGQVEVEAAIEVLGARQAEAEEMEPAR